MRAIAKAKKINLAQHNASLGQALVEFTLLLFLVMALCTGMLFIFRLLTFQFWAQQEARFLAFEQTWVPATAHSDSASHAVAQLKDGKLILRPKLVTNLDSKRKVENNGSLGHLLAFLFRSNEELNQGQRTEETAPMMLAKSGFAPFFEPQASGCDGVGEQSEVNLINAAWAMQDRVDHKRSCSLQPNDRTKTSFSLDDFPNPKPGMEQSLVETAEQLDIGGRACPLFAGIMRRHSYGYAAGQFVDSRCPENFNRGFGVHLAQQIDFPKAFRDYGFKLEQGQRAGQAANDVVQSEVAAGFYSFFDQKVRQAIASTINEMEDDQADFSQVAESESFRRMLSEMRYGGSKDALNAIKEQYSRIEGQYSPSWGVTKEKAFEDQVNKVLHEDVHGYLNFGLKLSKLPFPAELSSVIGGLQGGLMKNVLFNEGGLRESQIENSNKLIGVVYEADKGLFPAARKKFETEGIRLTANYYLVTQPWHIPRRRCATCGYRSLGDERDSIDSSSEEGILRRRTLGLWLFPKRITALLDPISEIVGLGDLSSEFVVFSAFDGLISEITDFVFSDRNPIKLISDALSEIKVIGDWIPRIPEFPAVRPQAYPRSVEIKNDQLTGSSRTFKDYVNEQKAFSEREPNPSFHGGGKK